MIDISERTIDPKFGDRPVRVREFTMLEAVPFVHSKVAADGVHYEPVPVLHTQYQFEQGGMIVNRCYGKVIALKVQAFDAYGYQREFSVEYRREPGTNSWRWVVTTYQHPFHRPDQDQVVSAGKARRFIDRLIELVEEYPSLVFNNSGPTGHTPPRHRPVNEGFVRWHTALLNGAEFTVKLLD